MDDDVPFTISFSYGLAALLVGLNLRRAISYSRSAHSLDFEHRLRVFLHVVLLVCVSAVDVLHFGAQIVSLWVVMVLVRR